MPITWHPTRMQDWCMTEDEKERIKEIFTQGIRELLLTMSTKKLYHEFKKSIIKMLKFGQIEAASKELYKQRPITDIFTVDVNKIVLSDKMSCNNGKDWQYIVGYQVDGIIPLFINTPKIIFR